MCCVCKFGAHGVIGSMVAKRLLGYHAHKLLQASDIAAYARPHCPPDGGPSSSTPGKKLSKVEELMKREMESKQAHFKGFQGGPSGSGAGAASGAGAGAGAGARDGGGRSDAWLAVGIVVKVLSKELQEYGYYKQKVRKLGVARKAARPDCCDQGGWELSACKRVICAGR